MRLAFTLWGPLETWQTADLDYSNPAGGVRYYYHNVEISFDDHELGGPKNFGEGSRLMTPIITYAFDNTFQSYFGAEGVAAVESAFAVLNALPSASTANLKSFPDRRGPASQLYRPGVGIAGFEIHGHVSDGRTHGFNGRNARLGPPLPAEIWPPGLRL